MAHPFRMNFKKIALLCLAAAAVGPFAVPKLLAQAPRNNGTRLWTCDIVSQERDASATGTLRPMLIIGARNGTFKVPTGNTYWLASSRKLRDGQAREGQKWFAQGWQDREKELFDLAGEVAAKVK